MSRNLSNLYISESFQFLIQESGSYLQTGLGSNLTGSLLITASLADNATTASYATTAASATSASYAVTASYAENAGVTVDTGSLMVTGSVSANTLTFTKGDGSTFNLVVDTGSAVTVDTGSLLTTASISDANITFTKGDASTFSIEVNNVTSSISASHAEFAVTASYATFASGAVDVNGIYTASISDATITFEKGDASTFDITVNNVTSSISSSYATTAASATTAGLATSASNAYVQVSAANVDYHVTFNTINAGYKQLLQETEGAQFTYNPSNNKLTVENISATTLSGSLQGNATTATSASYAATASYADDFTVGGTITALSASITYLETIYETASVIYSSGSNQFGDASNDTQTMYGTVDILTGPLNVSGAATFHNGITGSLLGNASTATSASYALTASYAENAGTTVDTGSLLTTASFNDAQITFTKGDGSTFSGVINNVSASISASYALTASVALSLSGSVESAVSSSYPIKVSNTGSNGILSFTYADNIGVDDNAVIIGGTNTIGNDLAQARQPGAVFIGGINNTYTREGDGSVGIGGENNNRNYGRWSAFVGGKNNAGNQDYFFMGGGISNEVVNARSAIVGGANNSSRIDSGFLGGGNYNKLYGYNRANSSIVGGTYNNITGSGESSIIGGKYNNIFSDVGGADNGDNYDDVIVGGQYNKINYSVQSAIVGGSNNLISGSSGNSITGSVIIGGSNITASANNTVYIPNLVVTGSLTAPNATSFVQNTTDTYATPKVSQIVTLTQAEYNAIGTPDDSTLYIISGSTPFNASSYATTGSNNFTGQITGDVTALTPSSNTASLDCSVGNFFTLTLGDGSNTLLEASNVTAGQTINLQVTNGAAGTGTISFGTGILQPTGSLYTGSAASSAIDVVSMISFDGATLLMNSVKQFV